MPGKNASRLLILFLFEFSKRRGKRYLFYPHQFRYEISFCLSENHFHLLLKEIKDGGITLFMRKLGTGMTNYYNVKYKDSGRLFQGAYKARLVDNENYLKYLSAYIQFKNILYLYPGGIERAVQNFDDAFDFVKNYSFCSLGEYLSNGDFLIIKKDILNRIFANEHDYKVFCKDCLIGSLNLEFNSVADDLLKSDFSR